MLKKGVIQMNVCSLLLSLTQSKEEPTVCMALINEENKVS